MMAGYRHLLPLPVLALIAVLWPCAARGQTTLDELAGVKVVSMGVTAETPIPAEMLPPLKTRPGQPFDPRTFNEDLQRLADCQRFVDVRPRYLFPESGGLEIVLDLVDLRSRWPHTLERLAAPQDPLSASRLRLQSPDPWKDAPPIEEVPRPREAETGQEVIDLRILGNEVVTRQKIQALVRTRAGRPFDRDVMNEDARRLVQSRYFLDVKGRADLSPDGGVVVTFTVVERPLLKEVKFLGNSKIKTSALAKESDLKTGSPLDPYTVDDARQRIEDLYKKKGFSNTRVEVLEGNQPGDRRAMFLINEGVKQRVKWVTFEGNTIVTDARLRTQIQSKPPILWIFSGFVDRQKIDADVDKLTAYYRSLGYFSARVGRELEWNEKESWLSLRFVIDEGPRYKIRSVAISGNLKFPSERLSEDLQLKQGEFFDQPKMNADVLTIQDVYGGEGYIFANVQPDPRFLEEPGQLDLIYSIDEGKRYRVGRIDVKITGEHPHTRVRTVLNRMSLRPGDIVDTRELRASERRLKASQLFNVDPTKGVSPKIVLVPQDEAEGSYANKPQRSPSGRGQSPDAPPSQAPPMPQPRPMIPTPPPAGNPQSSIQPSGRRDVVDSLPESTVQPLQVAQTEGSGRPGGAAVNSRSELTTFRGQSPDHRAPRAWQPQRPTPQTVGWVESARPTTTATRPTATRPTQSTVGLADSTHPTPTPTPSTGPSPYWRYQAGYSPSVIRGQSPAGVPPGYYQQPPPQARQTAQPPQYAVPPGATPPYGGPPMQQFGGPPPQPGLGPTFGAPLNPGAIESIAPPPMEGRVFPNQDQDEFVILAPTVEEARTGRLMFGVGVNSDAGLVGNVVLEEQNFDIMRYPTSWYEIWEGSAFRGAGQRLRIEAVPGTQVQRYMFNFSEPYLFDTPISFGMSAFIFDRRFRDWTESRYGGQLSLGYQITPDLSFTSSIRGEDVEVRDARTPTPPEVLEVLGHTDLYKARFALAHDTRDNTFLPTEGHLIELAYEQGFGEFTFPRGTLDLRQFFLIRQRPDGSGRHVIGVSLTVGVSGSDTPVMEHFFAGGTTTMRGFRFRGASPVNMGTIVGGEFEFLGSVEYLAPITADDALRAVFFCDFGTIAPDISSIEGDEFRVAPGFGLRISVPALGPAPIALDLAFPIAHADSDQIQNFSFRVGLFR